MSIFDEHSVIVMLLVIIIIWLFYLTFIREEPQPIQILNLEGYALSEEAIQNISAIYNKGELTVSNLTVTGTVTNAGLTNKVNSLQSSLQRQINTKQPTGNYVKYNDQLKINNIYDGWRTNLDTCGYTSCGGRALGAYSTYGSRPSTSKWRLIKS